jgi:hypothetical protein
MKAKVAEKSLVYLLNTIVICFHEELQLSATRENVLGIESFLTTANNLCCG